MQTGSRGIPRGFFLLYRKNQVFILNKNIAHYLKNKSEHKKVEKTVVNK